MRVSVVLAGLVLVLAGTSLAFLVAPADSATARPVQFSDTLTTGMTGVDVQQARAGGYELPRAQVFYSNTSTSSATTASMRRYGHLIATPRRDSSAGRSPSTLLTSLTRIPR